MTDVTKQVTTYMPMIFSSVAIFILFWIMASISKTVINRIAAHSKDDYAYVMNLLGQVVKAAILIFGGITALGTLGVNVSALVAGLGLTGFALGFALKDSLSNLLAGIMILIYKPYHRGQMINVAGESGRVSTIDLRYTVLLNDDHHVFIPNSLMLTKVIKVSQASQSKESTSS